MRRSLVLTTLALVAAPARAEPVVQSEHANDQFGAAVAIEGDRMAVGAPGSNEWAFDGGVVHVFQRDGEGWRRDAVLAPDEPVAHGAFGRVLALHGDILAIGAPVQADYGVVDRHGTAYVFERVAGAWEQRVALELVDVDADTFGTAAAIGATRAAFAADQRRRGVDVLSGAVVILVRDGDGWREEARIEGTDAQDGFGVALAMDDDHLVVTDFTGGAYVYHRDGAAWTGGEAIATDAKVWPMVRLSGEWLVFGGSGGLQFLRRTGATWTPRRWRRRRSSGRTCGSRRSSTAG